MRHHDKIKKFGRVRKQRTALLNSLARSLVLKEKIRTTEAKAKALRPFIEKLISKGRSGNLSDRRSLSAVVGKEASKKIVEEISPKYKERRGGYTRIIKLSIKRSDNAPVAQIEFV